MVTGYKDNKHKAFSNFNDAVEWFAVAGHETFHFCLGPVDGPKTKTDEHGGQPECYVANSERGAVIFESYRYGSLQHPESVL